MSDINLLPKELRGAETQEQAAKVAPAAPRYTTPAVRPSSQLEDRLQSLATPRAPGWFGRLKEWFMKPPAPDLVAPPPELTLPATPAPGLKRSTPTLRKSPPKPLTPQAKPLPTTEAGVASSAEVPPVGMVLDVNLLPVESRPVEVADGYVARYAVVAGVAAGLVVVGYGILSLLIIQRANHVSQIKQSAESLASQVDAFRPQLANMELASRKLKAVEQVISSRTDWSNLLDKLQALTLVNVAYTNASLSSHGDVSLGVEAASIGDLARQLKVFAESSNIFYQVTMGSISVNEETDQTLTHVESTFQLHLASGWAQADTSPAPGS